MQETGTFSEAKMTVGIFGESCTGKSTIAKLLQEKIGGAV